MQVLMSFLKVVLVQLSAHVIADFYLQSDNFCELKKKYLTKSLFLHAVFVFLLSWAAAWSLPFIIASLAITFFHFWIDWLKIKSPWLGKLKRNLFLKLKGSNFMVGVIKEFRTNDFIIFCIDQLLHIIIILAVVYVAMFLCKINCGSFIEPIPGRFLLFGFSVLLIMKPANIFIIKFLQQFNLSLESSPDDDRNQSLLWVEPPIYKLESSPDDDRNGLFHAGRSIGLIERFIILIFIVMGKLGAVAVLLTAKSILRFNQRKISEYILLGTLVSFGISFLCGFTIVYRNEIMKFINDYIYC